MVFLIVCWRLCLILIDDIDNITNLMGTASSQEVLVGQDFNHHQWQALNSNEHAFGISNTLRNRKTGAMVDEYQLSWNNYKQYEFYLKSFLWRHRQRSQGPIVNSLYLQEICKKQMCSNKYACNIYLEHIPMRLSQLEDIPISDTLFILQECLEGFMQLYQHSSYFRIDEELICIDRMGKVKVWVNSDLSLNCAQCDNECQRGGKDETHMVDQLIRLMSNITDRDQFPQTSLKQYFNIMRRKERVNIGFEYAKVILIEYAKLYHLNVSNRFDSYLQITTQNLTPSVNPILQPTNQSNITHRTFNNDLSTVKLNSSHSMPNIHIDNRLQYPAYSHSTNPTAIHYQPYYHLPINQPPNYPNTNPHIHPPNILKPPELEQNHPSQFISTNQQTKRKSKNSKSQMICILETTQNHSLNFNENEEGDDRNTMKSMPEGRHHSSTHRDQLRAYPRQSQCVQQINSQHQSDDYRYFNNDAFGINSRPRKMKDSNSSHKYASSNSSQSKYLRNEKTFGKKSNGSSKKESFKNERHEQYENYQSNIRYFVSLNEEEWDLDPQIEADMRKYFG